MRVSEDVKVEFRGHIKTKKFLTIMQEKMLLRQGCEAYLAHVVDVKKEAHKI